MKRTPSVLAQCAFDTVNRLQAAASHASFPVRQLARVANKVAVPLSKRVGTNHLVKAHLYGHDLVMPAEHPLGRTLAASPQYNRPLGLAAQAIAECSEEGSPLVVIDVGANIGETIAIIEQRCPGLGHYLCIEADKEIAEMCRLNHKGNDRVEVEQSFVGENEGAAVWLQDDGRANPSTKLAVEQKGSNCDRLVRLDTLAAAFVEQLGALSLIKTDTEGYDFSVLRSAPQMLGKYTPSLYIEWFPRLLTELGEQVWDGSDYLRMMGYRYFVFFTNHGDYHCAVDSPDDVFIRSMAKITERGSVEYFDVFACTDKAVWTRLVELASL